MCFSARCHYPARGGWGGTSHANQSVASWRHRSVLLSPSEGGGREVREVGGRGGHKTSVIIFSFMQPGKQLSHSEAVMNVHFAVSFVSFSTQCSSVFLSAVVCLMPPDALMSKGVRVCVCVCELPARGVVR